MKKTITVTIEFEEGDYSMDEVELVASEIQSRLLHVARDEYMKTGSALYGFEGPFLLNVSSEMAAVE